MLAAICSYSEKDMLFERVYTFRWLRLHWIL